MKLNLTFKLLIPIFSCLVVLAIVLGLLVSYILRQAMLERAKTFVANFVELQADNYIVDPTVFNSPSTYGNILFTQIENAVKTKEVVRTKVWNTHKTVIFSDDPSIIGQTFSDNVELGEALEGSVKTEIQQPIKQENVGEQGYRQLMEVYVPILRNNKVVGVIEIYYKLDALNSEIFQAQLQVFGLIFSVVLIISLIIYLLIRLFIIKPVAALEKGIEEIEKGNFDNKVTISSHDEIGSLAGAINKMSDGLKRLQELRDEFVFVGAHELRSPVTAIRGYISLIHEAKDVQLPEKIATYINGIKDLAERLNMLVGDILEVARSDAGKLEITVTECDLIKVVQAVLVETKPLAAQRLIDINYNSGNAPLFVLADESKLNEIVMNLVSNAIKYGREHGVINITHEITDKFIVTHIADNGLGIPLNDQKHIFEKFFRSGKVKMTTTQGTGLGLFITQQIVEKMNGKIWFSSKENEGTTFSFSLPNAIVK